MNYKLAQFEKKMLSTVPKEVNPIEVITPEVVVNKNNSQVLEKI